jgi:glycosyltransferase involved in cell wall biosynthesis
MWKWVSEQGHKVTTIILPQYREEVYKPIREGSFQQILMTPFSSDTTNFWNFPGLHDIAYKINPDVIFCIQEPWTYVAYDVMNIARGLGIKFGFFTWENIMKMFPNPWRKFESEVIKNADFAIGGNKDACEILLKKGAKDAIKEIQTGLDPALFMPEPKLKFSEKKEQKKVLFVGRMTESKGIKTIMQAFDKLPEEYVLRFVGGRGELEGLVLNHKEYGKRITLEPWTDYEQMPRVYNWADVSVMLSIDTPMWVEQFGYAIGESILCEVPVITSFSKSIIENWKLPGIGFCAQGDADAVVQLLTDKRVYDKKNNGLQKSRQYVIDNYSVEKVGERYIKILENIK